MERRNYRGWEDRLTTSERYFARNRLRAPFRPRVGPDRGDRYFVRDNQYWRRQMGRPQAFANANWRRGDLQARARRIPYMGRAEFAASFGQDADYDQWLIDRQYRPEDLANPRVFENIVNDRRFNFEDEPYATFEHLAPGDDPTGELEGGLYGELPLWAEHDEILYEQEIAEEDSKKRKREEDVDVDPEGEAILKKGNFEDAD